MIASIGQRDKGTTSVRKVKTKTLSTLFKEYGTPYYCKIDIEGFDANALRSMVGAKIKPTFTSAEAECKPEGESASEDGVLETLDELINNGYKKFKLVDQFTLKVLGVEDFYKNRNSFYGGVARKLQKN